jgi:hypothetical protein
MESESRKATTTDIILPLPLPPNRACDRHEGREMGPSHQQQCWRRKVQYYRIRSTSTWYYSMPFILSIVDCRCKVPESSEVVGRHDVTFCSIYDLQHTVRQICSFLAAFLSSSLVTFCTIPSPWEKKYPTSSFSDVQV